MKLDSFTYTKLNSTQITYLKEKNKHKGNRNDVFDLTKKFHFLYGKKFQLYFLFSNTQFLLSDLLDYLKNICSPYLK